MTITIETGSASWARGTLISRQGDRATILVNGQRLTGTEIPLEINRQIRKAA